MTNTLKLLGQSQLGDANELVYSTPSATSTVISSLSITNTSGNPASVDLYVDTDLVRGIYWTSRPARVQDANALLYANGVYLAGGDDGSAGEISTSTDGLTWTTRDGTFPIGPVTALTYGNGLYVAASGLPTIRTSTDAITWTTRTYGLARSINGLAYGNGVYVSVGNVGTIATSTDGITWTSRVSNFPLDSAEVPAQRDVVTAVYGNGLFIAAGDGGAMSSSTDGITWATRTSGTTAGITSLIYANNKYVALASTSVISSTDGITWTSSPIGVSLTTISYGSGIYVAAGASQRLRTSTDLITWTTRTVAFSSNDIRASLYNDGLFILAGQGNVVATNGLVDSPGQLLYQTPILPKTTVTLTCGLTLEAGAQLYAKSSLDGAINVNIFGSEVS